MENKEMTNAASMEFLQMIGVIIMVVAIIGTIIALIIARNSYDIIKFTIIVQGCVIFLVGLFAVGSGSSIIKDVYPASYTVQFDVTGQGDNDKTYSDDTKEIPISFCMTYTNGRKAISIGQVKTMKYSEFIQFHWFGKEELDAIDTNSTFVCQTAPGFIGREWVLVVPDEEYTNDLKQASNGEIVKGGSLTWK